MNIDIYIAVTGFLLLLCVFANKLSDRFGIPSLLLFCRSGLIEAFSLFYNVSMNFANALLPSSVHL